MLSDRGNSEAEADMQFSQLPVTPKSGGLNPNANVFHCKIPPTPPESTIEGWTGSGDEMPTDNQPQAVTTVEVVGVPYMNGDVDPLVTPQKHEHPSVPLLAFPPTPESPPLLPCLTTQTEAQVNGGDSPTPETPDTPPPTTPTPTVSELSNPDENEGTSPDSNVSPQGTLKSLLRTQLEYYFSRENLANDTYLVSQMDSDQYVSIHTVANFNQVKKLTASLELVVEVLRESPNVQVDPQGEKVRPLHKRCVVILREIPEATPVEDVCNLFSSPNCPRFVSCEFAHNNNWYVTFATDEDAQRAYQYLREEVRTFQGKPIMARIKAKPILRSTFMPKNGYKQQQQQQQQPPQQAPAAQPPAAAYPTPQPFTPYQPVPTTPTQYVISQQNYPFFPPSTVVQPWPAAPTAAPLPFFDPGTAFAANGYTAAATYKMPASNNNNQGRRDHGYQNSRNRNPKPHRGNNMDRDRGHERDRYDNRNSHDRLDGRLHDSRGIDNRGGSGHMSHGDRMDGGRIPHDRHNHDRLAHDRHMGIPSRSSPRSNPDNSHRDMATAPPRHRHDPHPVTCHAHPGHTVTVTSTAPPATHMPPPSHSHDHSTLPVSSSGLSLPMQRTEPLIKEQAAQSAQAKKPVSYRSRRRKEEESSKPTRGSAASGTSSPSAAASKDSARVQPAPVTPKFDLEATAFPPLPGASSSKQTTKSTSASGEIFENKMSDVVKGTAKATTRPETKTSTAASQTANVHSMPSSTNSSTESTMTTSAVTCSTITTNTTSVTTVSTSTSSTTQHSATVPSTSTSQPTKVSRSTSTDKAESVGTVASSNATTQTAPATPSHKADTVTAACQSMAPKLSYAQAVQAAAQQRAAEEAAKSANTDKSEQSTTSAGQQKPAALREQAQQATSTVARSQTNTTAWSSSSNNAESQILVHRKSSESASKSDVRANDGRLPQRPLKENRGERRERTDRYPSARDTRDNNMPTYRDRRREPELRPNAK